MLIAKAINHNAALARDEQGNEVVIFATGVGFPKTPYMLEDESGIQRVFHHVDGNLLRVLSSIPADVLQAATEIAAIAENELDCELNPNLFFTLADHLQFTVEHLSRGTFIDNPLAGEIPYIYPSEYRIGCRGIKIVGDRVGVHLPDEEACSIALHIVNAEGARDSTPRMRTAMRDVETIEDAVSLVEEVLGPLDRASHAYRRFVAHLRYLLGMTAAEDGTEMAKSLLLDQVARDFPEAHVAAQRIGDRLEAARGASLTSEELLYLMLHINRLESEARAGSVAEQRFTDGDKNGSRS